MLTETLVRFALGGALVALFAVVGNAFVPRTFAGIFGAAPSVALATLAMTYARHGAPYVAIEARSMMGGAAALALCSLSAIAQVKRRGLPPWLAAMLLCLVWFGAASVAWMLLRA